MINSSIINCYRRKTMIMLIYTWILCSTILTFCFTSVLLNVYTIKIPSITVKNLEEIVKKPRLLVAGYTALLPLRSNRPDIFHALKDRVANYHNKLKMDLYNERVLPENLKLVHDIVQRKAVVLVPTFTVDMFKRFHRNSNLKESDEKLHVFFRFSLISKNIPKHKEVIHL